MLTQQELNQLKILSDPVMWAETTLRDPKFPNKNLSLRDYQKTMLRNKSNRKVSRCGRRVGKCISPTSRILTSEGPIEVQKVYAMKERPAILTFNEGTFDIEITKNYIIFPNGKQPTYRLTTGTGRQTEATGNHPFLTIGKEGTLRWLTVDEMVPGDRIATPATYAGLIKGTLVGAELSRLLGYLCGNKKNRMHHISFTSFDDLVTNDLSKILSSHGYGLESKKGDTEVYSTSTNIDAHELIYKTKNTVPPVIMSGTDNDIANFIAAYWDVNGWCGSRSKTYNGVSSKIEVDVGMNSSSQSIIMDIQHLLLRLGIVAQVKKRKSRSQGKWQVILRDLESISKFYKIMPLRSKKKELLSELINKMSPKSKFLDKMPKGVSFCIKDQHISDRVGVNKAKIAEYAKEVEDEYLKRVTSNHIIWDQIEDIEYIGEFETYDLTVPETSTFIADDIISHNTLTMVTHILWYAFTHQNSKQVIATPYDSQITLMFDMIKQLVEATPEIQQSIEFLVKSPHHKMKLKNGAVISGFTAGTRSGAAGGSLRGQAADWIYMDEVDYMTDDDFETIYAIALEAPERIGVWISSTPTGRRGKFWSACNDKKNWEEFYFPSMVNPEWSDKMESELRGMFSNQGYIHEVLAEFGDETIGVFKKEYIDRSKCEYHYIGNPTHKAIRAIGVDWDKYGEATQILVVEYNQSAQKFQVINRVEIPKSEFTLDNAVERIKILNQIYDPQMIYIDRGYGEYQVETLRKYGMNNPETELHKRIRPVSFSEKKEFLDPFTKIKDKKPIKPFMVNQLQLLFERDMMMISEYDEVLIRQLENYQVVKQTILQGPIFTSEDEHALDCLMLTILGFVENYPDIMNTVIEFKPANRVKTISIVTRNGSEENISTNRDNKRYLEWDEPGLPPPTKGQVGVKPEKYKKMYSWSTRGTNLKKAHRRTFW